MSVEEVRRQLWDYRALGNGIRLNAFLEISRQPGVSFNELSRIIGVERGLLAYHLAVLKAAGIVKVSYERRSKQTSKYELTREGERLAQELCSSGRRRTNRAKKQVNK
jgi:DNA-binding transcriptional ArsR family regulator